MTFLDSFAPLPLRLFARFISFLWSKTGEKSGFSGQILDSKKSHFAPSLSTIFYSSLYFLFLTSGIKFLKIEHVFNPIQILTGSFSRQINPKQIKLSAKQNQAKYQTKKNKKGKSRNPKKQRILTVKFRSLF